MQQALLSRVSVLDLSIEKGLDKSKKKIDISKLNRTGYHRIVPFVMR